MDVFLHIPKASGTTIRTIISREYGAAGTVYYEPESEHFAHRDDPESFLRTRLADPEVRLITGHLRYGIHEFLRKPCRYFSMVRDPIERALSEYFYAFAYPTHRYREQIISGGMSFVDFLGAETPPATGVISHFLSGWFRGQHSSAEVARFHLQNCLMTVGISERFDESLLLIARDLGWRPPLYLLRNVTRLDENVRERRRRASEDAKANVRGQFAGDYLVYEEANRMLTSRIDALGDGFQQALENYKELQEALVQHDNPLIFDEYNLEQDDDLPSSANILRHSTPYLALADYLRQGPAKPADRRCFVGYFDGRASTVVAGWAMDMSRSTPITVTLRRRTEVIARTLCNIPRPDVVASGFPETPCGFRFILSDSINDWSDIAVFFEDSNVRLLGDENV